jgi:pyruvate dehydrogenase E1 component
MRRGGHDPEKVYAAYKAATENTGSPTVILAKTIKGYGLGEAGEGKNITHQQKKLNEEELRQFRTRFGIPISDEEVAEAPFYRPRDDSPLIHYLKERRRERGGGVPNRTVTAESLVTPDRSLFDEFRKGTDAREVSTTMAFVRILSKLLRDKGIGERIVPIIPDEARTFGMEALFSQFGIYSHVGQLYEPVDAGSLMYYKEARGGQILEEGITEAGSLSSFIAAGTAYASHGINMIPFFIFYSMFGFQRVGDLIWAAGDMRCKGFLVGATAGRTTLAGEGLQHQDGNSHLLAYPVPNLKAYDPAFAYELGVIIEDGIRRMYEQGEEVFYYITVENENYPMPSMPKGVSEGILKGMYRFKAGEQKAGKPRVQLLGSGAILNEALKAQALLEGDYGVTADVWSVTSFKELHNDGVDAQRWNMLNPKKKPQIPYVTQCLSETEGPVIVASDYVKALGNSVVRWMPGKPVVLGTDGFGRSESREELRDFFEVDHRHITLGALHGLVQEGKLKPDAVAKAMKKLDVDPNRPDPSKS